MARVGTLTEHAGCSSTVQGGGKRRRATPCTFSHTISTTLHSAFWSHVCFWRQRKFSREVIHNRGGKRWLSIDGTNDQFIIGLGQQASRAARFLYHGNARASYSEQIRANRLRLSKLWGEIPYRNYRGPERRTATPFWLLEMWRFVSRGAGTCVTWIYACKLRLRGRDAFWLDRSRYGGRRLSLDTSRLLHSTWALTELGRSSHCLRRREAALRHGRFC